MAMYYQGSSEIQGDALQTLYLMNPNYVGYSDTQNQPQPNMPFLNSATTTAVHALNSPLVPHAPLPQFVGIPLSHDPSRPSSVLAHQDDHIQTVQTSIPRYQYNIWGLVDQGTNGNQPNMPQQNPQGLSLSLSHHQTGFDKSSIGTISPKNCSSSSLTNATDQSNGVNTVKSVILGSKYLKAAQELLDEVANVGKGAKTTEETRDKAKIVKESAGAKAATASGESGGKGGGAELSTAQRQEIQMKKAKLNSMLDEVEQRCKQYHHQMQIVIASFEQVAGAGSAKCYTQLALKTILKQFRCLKATISAQIKALSKSLGEEESLGDHKLDGSRLKFVDHQLRQQRALQQLGMMNNNAWRPQRGLPERAVSVLRAWLFEHFLHPYPKDSDKQMLAKQTGLTRSQVSNWFINARVRLWKPMVEEMYVEEMKNQEQITSDQDNTIQPGLGKDLISKQQNTTRMDNRNPLQSKQDKFMLNLVNTPTEISPSTTTKSLTGSSGGFSQLISSLNMENLPGNNPKRPRQDNSPSSILSVDVDMKGGGSRENYGTGFETYGIGELGRFNNLQGNNFSLTLGLPPSETPRGAHRNSFEFGTRIENGTSRGNGINNQGVATAANSHPNIGYEILDFQNRKNFPAQLLPDFVA
ncbi:Transcription factor MEIS1 [Handroanthus impetiginosus]|uniref:Transcription factor MEIS1 n=1 Tax=Handroanthus impetiginosus TaxID=429701 RepID=A0A2G9GCU6_9LAMI|nr:Transcription factor MEIS1 [Handroanthus impetiginosus]